MKQTKAEHLPIEKLCPFEGHPFQIRDDEEMDQLVWSVLTQGILTPIVVRPLDTGQRNRRTGLRNGPRRLDRIRILQRRRGHRLLLHLLPVRAELRRKRGDSDSRIKPCSLSRRSVGKGCFSYVLIRTVPERTSGAHPM